MKFLTITLILFSFLFVTPKIVFSSGWLGAVGGITIDGLSLVKDHDSYISNNAPSPAKYLPGAGYRATLHVNNSNDSERQIKGFMDIFQVSPGYCRGNRTDIPYDTDLKNISGVGGTDVPGADPGLTEEDLDRDYIGNTDTFSFGGSNDPNNNDRDCQTNPTYSHMVGTGVLDFTVAAKTVTDVSFPLTLPMENLPGTNVPPEGYYQWDICLEPWCILGSTSEATAAGFLRIIPGNQPQINHNPTLCCLEQYKPDGTTSVPIRGWINKADVGSGNTRVTLKFAANDPDPDPISYRLRAKQLEGGNDDNYLNNSGTANKGTPTTVKTFNYDNGTLVTLPDGKYRWGVEAKDDKGGQVSACFDDCSSTQMDYGVDTGPPGISINANRTSPTQVSVSWSGNDAISGVKDYDVEYVESEADSCPSNDWQGWGKYGTTQTSGTLKAQPNRGYWFRARARDVALNLGDWSCSKVSGNVSEAWIQVVDGDVHSNDGINLKNTPNLKYFANGQTVVSANSSSANVYFGVDGNYDTTDNYRAHPFTIPDWRALGTSGSSLSFLNYSYFYRSLVEGKSTKPFNGAAPASSGVYYLSTISTSLTGDWRLGPNIKAVIVIDGDLNINPQEVTVPVGSSLVFIVNGRIQVNPNVKKLQGLYLTQRKFVTVGTGDQLEAQGAYIAFDGFDLRRDLNIGNPASPAEKFTYRPDLLINTISLLSRSQFGWQEVAP